MHKETLEYNVRHAIAALQDLMNQGYKVEDEAELEWKDKYFDLVFTIQNHLKGAEELYADMKANGLTLGTAEAEGYLRGAKYLFDCVKDDIGVDTADE
jgi:hypothetical protein